METRYDFISHCKYEGGCSTCGAIKMYSFAPHRIIPTTGGPNSRHHFQKYLLMKFLLFLHEEKLMSHPPAFKAQPVGLFPECLRPITKIPIKQAGYNQARDLKPLCDWTYFIECVGPASCCPDIMCSSIHHLDGFVVSLLRAGNEMRTIPG